MSVATPSSHRDRPTPPVLPGQDAYDVSVDDGLDFADGQERVPVLEIAAGGAR